MYVKAAYTLENSVIIPMFIVIVISLIAITGFYHDKIIIKGAIELAAVKLEQLPEENRDNEIQTLRVQLKDYIVSKTLFMKNVSITISDNSNDFKVSCNSEYGLVSLVKNIGQSNTTCKVSKNKPCDLIRITEAAMEVIKY